jgi:ParB-like nuclease domain
MSNLGAKGFNPKKGSMPVLNYMPPAMLTVDAAYQRSIDNTASQKLIIHIAKNWNWDLCQPLVVNRREDGTLAVADGQHRLTAAKMRGDIDVLPCVVCNLPDAASEAELFVQFNRNRKTLSQIDLWKASVASGDQSASEITAALHAAGMRIANTSNTRDMKPGQMTNIGSIRRCHASLGIDHLRAVLQILGEAFGSEPMPYNGTLFSGISSIVSLDAPADGVAAWAAGHRSGMVTECIAARPQAEWFRLVQTAVADGNGRKDASERVFRQAWKVWQAGNGGNTGATVYVEQRQDPPAPAPAPRLNTAHPEPVEGRPPKAPKPAPERVPFEEQLRRVGAGEVGIVEKIEMKRHNDDRTLGGVVGEINN